MSPKKMCGFRCEPEIWERARDLSPVVDEGLTLSQRIANFVKKFVRENDKKISE